MSITLDEQETRCLLWLDGELDLGSAGELKGLLGEWLVSGKDLDLDLSHVEQIDVANLQLLYVAGREAALAGAKVVCRLSDAIRMAARESGFAGLPEFPVEV